jgi:hypothetical protein
MATQGQGDPLACWDCREPTAKLAELIMQFGIAVSHAETPAVFRMEGGSLSLSLSFFFFFFFFLVFRERVSLCSPGCPGTHSVDQAGLKLRNPPASASQVLGLKACTTTPGLVTFLLP